MRLNLFSKIFLSIFVALLFVLSIFMYESIDLQKKSIQNILKTQAKTIYDTITFVNTEAMIVDDEITILEFVYDLVQGNKNIDSIIISRKGGNDLIIKNSSWSIKEKSLENFDYIEKFKIKRVENKKENAFFYSKVIILSGLKWGSMKIQLKLDDYEKALTDMYLQFTYLVIVLFLSSFLIALFLANIISKPIIRLNKTIKEISHDELSKRVEVTTSDEIADLGKSFNNMLNILEISQIELKKSHLDLEYRVIQRTKELKVLNETLEQRVSTEIKKQQEQEQMLIHQSKLAAMGEMIGNIAHQWRQPLNALGLVVQNIKLSFEFGDLDSKFMNESINKVNMLTKSMSKTIDDFRNFYKPNKEKEYFDMAIMVKKSLNLIDSTFQHYDISIDFKYESNIMAYGFANEFSQTLLNILNNSKDALISNDIKNSKIKIDINKDEKYAFVSIKDNAGGISEEIIERVFDPYFTTKEEGKGTGIGLYMSKIIIEQNMSGKLLIKNEDDGVIVIVKIPLDENK